MRCLQPVQNAAVGLLTRTRRRDHITPILRELHWLPVSQQVTFKIAVLVFQCLTGQTPAYLTDDCQLTSDVQITVSATGVLRLPDNSCGTRCQFIYGSVTVFDSLNGCQRHICLVIGTAALCDTFS